MKKTFVIVVVLLVCAAATFLWHWSDHSEQLPAMPESKQCADSPTNREIDTAKNEPVKSAPTKIDDNPTDELLETWMDSLVKACMKQEIGETREIYTRLRQYRHRLRSTSIARYDSVLISTEPYDGKLMALGFLALIRQDDDFLSICLPLRERWTSPFSDAARATRWKTVESKWVVITAEQALDPEDQMLASVVSFIVLEQLRENDSKRLARSLELLQSILPIRSDSGSSTSATEIPDPWISAVLKHAGRRVSEFTEPCRTQFLSYVAWICGRYEYTPRLRHQAKLMLYRPAESKFELLVQIGDAMSEHDAAKAIADFLTTNRIDAADLELIIDCLIAKFGRAKVGHIMAWTFKNLPSLSNADVARTFAGLFISLVREDASEDLAAATVDGLRSLEVEFASWWRKKNTGEVPLLLDKLGFDAAPYLRTVLKNRAKIRNRCGETAGNICEWNIVWHIFQLSIALPQKMELLDELLSDVSPMRFSLLSAAMKCLQRISVEELLPNQALIISKVDGLLASTFEKLNESDSQSARISATWAMVDLCGLLKICGFPSLTEPAIRGVVAMRQAYSTGLVAEGALAKRLDSYVRSAEAGYDELVKSGYSLPK